MFVLGLGIPVLVLYLGYKKVQTSGKRKAILVLNILLTIFTAFSLFGVITNLLSAGLLSSGAFSDILKDADFDSTYVNPDEIVNATMSMASTFLWVLTVIDAIIVAFGIVVNILGYKALANKTWTANANADAENKRINSMNAMNANYGQPQPYQQNYNQQPMQNTYGQPPVQNAYGQQPVQNAYGQQPVQNTYGQQPIQNTEQPAAQVSGDWYCVCGNKNPAGQNFCSNCGTANPNNK